MYHRARAIIQGNSSTELILLKGHAALGQLVSFGAFCSLRLVLFCSSPLSASVASFGQLFERVQWNIPRQVKFKLSKHKYVNK